MNRRIHWIFEMDDLRLTLDCLYQYAWKYDFITDYDRKKVFVYLKEGN